MTIIKTTSSSQADNGDAAKPGSAPAKDKAKSPSRAAGKTGGEAKAPSKAAQPLSAPADMADMGQSIEEVKQSQNRRSSLLSCEETTSDSKSDQAVRPDSLGEYIGQSRLKSMLSMSISAAKVERRGSRSCSILWSAGAWARRHWRG
jgi:hypothetical protein